MRLQADPTPALILRGVRMSDPKIELEMLPNGVEIARVSGDNYTTQVVAPQGMILYAEHVALEAWRKRCDPKSLLSWCTMMAAKPPQQVRRPYTRKKPATDS